jgi:hypothetical protein
VSRPGRIGPATPILLVRPSATVAPRPFDGAHFAPFMGPLSRTYPAVPGGISARYRPAAVFMLSVVRRQ